MISKVSNKRRNALVEPVRPGLPKPSDLPALRKGIRATSPDLMTEEELIKFLRIPEVSKSGNHHHVI